MSPEPAPPPGAHAAARACAHLHQLPSSAKQRPTQTAPRVPRPANLQTGFVPEPSGRSRLPAGNAERSAPADRGAGGARGCGGPRPGPAPAPPPAAPRPQAAAGLGGGAPSPGCRTPAEQGSCHRRPLCSPLSGSACGRRPDTWAKVRDAPAWGMFCPLCSVLHFKLPSPSSPAPRPGGYHFCHIALALPSQKPGPRGRTLPGFQKDTAPKWGRGTDSWGPPRPTGRRGVAVGAEVSKGPLGTGARNAKGREG